MGENRKGERANQKAGGVAPLLTVPSVKGGAPPGGGAILSRAVPAWLGCSMP